MWVLDCLHADRSRVATAKAAAAASIVAKRIAHARDVMCAYMYRDRKGVIGYCMRSYSDVPYAATRCDHTETVGKWNGEKQVELSLAEAR